MSNEIKLTKYQKDLFKANYMLISNMELSIMMNVNYDYLRSYIKRVSMKEIEKCDYFKKKDEVHLDSQFRKEPEFSKAEIESYSDSFREPNTDFVGKRIEEINGKQCAVFQSRMNY